MSEKQWGRVSSFISVRCERDGVWLLVEWVVLWFVGNGKY